MPNPKYARRAKPAELPPTPADVVHVPEVLPRAQPPAKTDSAIEAHRQQLEKLAGLKNEVFELSMGVVRDSLRFRDVDPYEKMEESATYKQLVKEMGPEEATKVYRLAEAGWRTGANAPVGIKNAMNTAIGIMKANATEKGGSRVFNVGKVLIADALVPQFEEREVSDDGR